MEKHKYKTKTPKKGRKMSKSIAEVYNEMRGGKKVETQVEQPKKIIPIPETIEHKSDPIVKVFLEQKQKEKQTPKKETDTEKDKVKLGVKTPIDTDPETDDEVPSDSVADQTPSKKKKNTKKCTNEGLLSALASPTLGFVGGVGRGMLGKKPNEIVYNPTRYNVIGSVYKRLKAASLARQKAKKAKETEEAKKAKEAAKAQKSTQTIKAKKTTEHERYVKAIHNMILNLK